MLYKLIIAFMKGKLVKNNHFYALQIDNNIIAVSLDRETPEHTVNYKYSLSKQNCDEIFGIVDVEKLANERSKTCEDCDVPVFKAGYYDGFQEGFEEAMELSKHKLFTESDIFSVVNHILSKLVKVDGFDQKYLFPEEVYQEVTWKAKQIQQPTEIDVEVIMDRIPADLAPGGWDVFPKLDSQGCLILKKVL
jgi:hypothetical protein